MKALNLTSILVFMILMAACGIKGNPQPPFEPATLGRGRPSFKQLGKELKINDDASKDLKEDEDEKL